MYKFEFSQEQRKKMQSAIRKYNAGGSYSWGASNQLINNIESIVSQRLEADDGLLDAAIRGGKHYEERCESLLLELTAKKQRIEELEKDLAKYEKALDRELKNNINGI